MAKSWVFLSPHLDDAVYSCGGWIAEQAEAGDAVEIWTIVAGDVPPGLLTEFADTLHQRWGVTQADAFAVRRDEDAEACRIVGASHRHFDLPDCIYRRHPQTGEAFYPDHPAIFGLPAVEEKSRLPTELAGIFRSSLPAGAQVLLPLTVGNHVDHQLVRLAGELLPDRPWYYADLPYVLWDDSGLATLPPDGFMEEVFPIGEPALGRWLAGVRAYASQFNSFWQSPAELEEQIRAYLAKTGGLRLWHPADWASNITTA